MRRAVLATALGAPVALALFLYGSARMAVGDYLSNAWAPRRVDRLRLNPWPTVLKDELTDRSTSETYWALGGRIERVVTYEYGGAGGFSSSWRDLMTRAAGGYYRLYSSDFQSPLSGPGELAERYPAGALDAFGEALGEGVSEAALAQAKLLVDRFPDRATPKYWVASLTARLGRPEEARELLERWRPEFAAEPLAQGERLVAFIEHDIAATAPEEAARREEFDRWMPWRAWNPNQEMPKTGEAMPFSFEEWLEWVRGVDATRQPKRFTLEPRPGSDYSARDALVGELVSYAPLLCLDGRSEDAIHLLAQAWRLDADSNAPHRGHMVGPNAKGVVALCAMADAILRAKRTPDELRAAFELVETIAGEHEWLDRLGILRRLEPGFDGPFPTEGYQALLNEPNDSPRAFVARRVAEIQHHDAYLQLLREAIRVRHYRAVQGAWPAIGLDGAAAGLELSPSGPPIFDPCSPTPSPIRAERVGDGFRLRSVGPDMSDDRGKKMAGESLEATFIGDLFIDLAPDPELDYPADAGHLYSNADEFRRRYPNGIPRERGAYFHRYGATTTRVTYDPASNKLVAWRESARAIPSSSPPTLVDHLFAAAAPVAAYDPRKGLSSGGARIVELRVEDPSAFPTLAMPPTPLSPFALPSAP